MANPPSPSEAGASFFAKAKKDKGSGPTFKLADRIRSLSRPRSRSLSRLIERDDQKPNEGSSQSLATKNTKGLEVLRGLKGRL